MRNTAVQIRILSTAVIFAPLWMLLSHNFRSASRRLNLWNDDGNHGSIPLLFCWCCNASPLNIKTLKNLSSSAFQLCILLVVFQCEGDLKLKSYRDLGAKGHDNVARGRVNHYQISNMFLRNVKVARQRLTPPWEFHPESRHTGSFYSLGFETWFKV